MLLADRVLVLDEGRIAVDLSIEQARPRRHGDPAAAHYREQLLAALGVSTEPTQYEDDAR
ncbi:hypothetical protein B7C42_08391 [Nocardia cerradoensis]|uniref:Uncharacterized protein n=1 Tax=Nocardia cerradoensis TaxID=85688 RepID=A0A231GSU0_9NOCA|nr:hypothetical protein B7C42_08391 [Nocardia cerradoensis]